MDGAASSWREGREGVEINLLKRLLRERDLADRKGDREEGEGEPGQEMNPQAATLGGGNKGEEAFYLG